MKLYTLRCPNCGAVVLSNLMNPGREGDLVFQCECNAIVELYWKGGNDMSLCGESDRKETP